MSMPDSEAFSKLLIVLEAHDLPTEPQALDKALSQAVEDYMALAERYDKLSDIADSYAEISNDLLYKI